MVPQGYIASGDGFCHRFDEVTRKLTNFKRCVDDSCVYENTIEELFYNTCKYLSTMGAAGIIMNPDKFHFGDEETEFLRFILTWSGL